MERLTIQRIDDAICKAKMNCPYYGEPRGCNYPPGPLFCCGALDDVAELAKVALEYKDTGLTPEEVARLARCNGGSPNCADFTEPEDTCEECEDIKNDP